MLEFLPKHRLVKERSDILEFCGALSIQDGLVVASSGKKALDCRISPVSPTMVVKTLLVEITLLLIALSFLLMMFDQFNGPNNYIYLCVGL